MSLLPDIDRILLGPGPCPVIDEARVCRQLPDEFNIEIGTDSGHLPERSGASV